MHKEIQVVLLFLIIVFVYRLVTITYFLTFPNVIYKEEFNPGKLFKKLFIYSLNG